MKLVLLWFIALLAQAATQPLVVLVSLDGFRYDYATRDNAKNLLALGNAGASAALIPSFPTVTFPNHLSIVTGLYPEHHGIVMNKFHDPARNADYDNKTTAPDGSWYSGTPLWVLAEKQGVKAASMFWPGSDAKIDGVRPSYWSVYDGKVPNAERVDRVLNWLKLPEAERPRFITLYFDDTDVAGHKFGPDSPELHQAVQTVDGLVGQLWRGIQATGLPVNLIVVSDHGMQAASGSVDLTKYVDPAKIRIVNEGPFALLYAPDPAAATAAYKALKGKNSDFDVYRRAESPARWHYRENPRAGDLIVILTKPMTFTLKPTDKPVEGRHGYDPARFKTMRGIFYAAGPNIRPTPPLPPFENVDIYPFIAEILGLKPPPALDGSAKVLQPVWRP